VKVLAVTVMSCAPRPTPEAWAFASLPMPRAIEPRFLKVLPSNVIRSAAEIWTAPGVCDQPLREPSKPRQPRAQDVNASAGRCCCAPVMNVPVCWFA
jgi:hypothetical protein